MQEKINKVIWSVVFLLLFLLLLCFVYTNSFQKNDTSFDTHLFYMDTSIYVNLYEQNETKAKEALEEVEKLYQKYHQLTDRYQAYENVINLYFLRENTREEEWLTIDSELYFLLEESLKYYKMSDGLFAIQMGNLTDVWKRAIEEETLPSREELEKTKEYKEIILQDGKIYNNHANIDLGAVAKGYATKKVGEYLNSIGIKKYIINAGGNVLVGEHYGRDAYKIGIEDPTSSIGGIFAKVKANNKAVVTSGGYQRFFEIDGKRYNHIINPKTLYPSDNFLSVTVIAGDSMQADILSTILFLMDIDTGLEWIEGMDDVEAIWYVSEFEQIVSSGFNEYLYE